MLNETGRNYVLAVKSILEHLSVEGKLITETGHTIVMTEDGKPGFQMDYHNDKSNKLVVMQIDSDEVWSFIINHARNMTKQDIIRLRDGATLARGY